MEEGNFERSRKGLAKKKGDRKKEKGRGEEEEKGKMG
jgi:hypothetical protein